MEGGWDGVRVGERGGGAGRGAKWWCGRGKAWCGWMMMVMMGLASRSCMWWYHSDEVLGKSGGRDDDGGGGDAFIESQHQKR